MASGGLPLAVTMGDPAGVGPQITWDAWRQRSAGQQPFFVIASSSVMRAVSTAGPLQEISSPEEAAGVFERALPVLAIDCPLTPQAGVPDVATAGATIRSIELAVEAVQSGAAAAVVTNPIAKALLYQAGFEHPGHTEFLAHLARDEGKTPRPVMMLVGGGLRVALATIHVPLRSVPDLLSRELIREIALIVDRSLRQDFGIASPRIGLCGLNPHAGESGALGIEERDIINPAAQALRAEGVDISDARPGDTIFHEALGGRFDAVIAMAHDQGLIPVKTLDMWGGVNMTLGLRFVRTSPDHGVGYDAARDGVARADSLLAAIALASTVSENRRVSA